MPRYDYRCTACDAVFEIEHGMREHPQISCPTCGAPAERLLNASGIVLKGSGFYNTDQRGKKGGTEATSGTTASDSGTAAESKPADKPAEAAPTCAAADSCACSCGAAE